MQFTRIITTAWISLGLVTVTPVAARAQQSNDLDHSELVRLMRTAPPAPQRLTSTYYTDSDSRSPEHRAVIEYDVVSGRVTRSPASEFRKSWQAPPPDLPFLGRKPGSVEDNVSLESRDITPTPPTPHADNTAYPWRTMYKMLMRFDVSGVNHYYVCTGWASGSFHVVTAGHCIYNWDPNDDGSDSDAKWADEVWLYAGQGDVVWPVDDPDLGVDWPYGIAKSVHLRSYEGWTDWENHSHDWGVVTLDRRTGDRVGWMGRESDCGNSLNFSGYPAETPYVPEDTVLQYYGYDPDNVDYCWIHRIGMDAYKYGGHSGGPSWRYESATGDRYVEGVHSTSNRTGDTQETRLTDGKRSDLNAWMAADETGRPPTSRPDLQEYYLGGTGYKDLVTPSVSQGETIQVEYNAYNSGHAAANGAEVAFYLSTNTNITTSDHAIGTRTHDIAAGGSINQFATLTVPTSVPIGTYYVGWILSWSGTEYTTSNNKVLIATEMLTVREERDITVTSPNGGEEWPAGYSRMITWTSTDAGSNVRIELTRNGGIGWHVITASTPNDGSYTWTVTEPGSSTCRIRITSTAYPTVQDESDSDFRIIDRTITVTYPTDPVVWYISELQFVGWNSTDAGSDVEISISRDQGATWETIAASTPNDGLYFWYPTGPASSRCRIRVSSNTYAWVSDTSNADFTITERRIIVTAPNGGEFWPNGGYQQITWSKVNAGATVRIDLSRDSGSTWSAITASTANDGTYYWAVLDEQSESCRIRVTSIEYPAVSDASDADFTAGSRSIAVVSPNGGEIWTGMAENTITWTSALAGATVDIEITGNGGAVWEELASGTPNDGEFTWLVGPANAYECLVRITSVEYPAVSDTSDAAFIVETPLFADGFETGDTTGWTSVHPTP